MRREWQPRLRTILAAACAALLAGCGSQEADGGGGDATVPATPAAVAEPDLAACPARELLEEGLRQRTEPLAVPAVFRDVMRSGMDNFAFTTREGATVCVDASWMEEIHDPSLSADGRFASFDWAGYEAFGHVIVDLSDAGQVLDTGVAPVLSPSGQRFAAADLSESGYGALNAFAVWQIEPAGIRQLGKQEEVLPATDWHIERWSGERCLELTAIPWDGYTGEADAPRERFRAREAADWRIEPGRCVAE